MSFLDKIAFWKKKDDYVPEDNDSFTDLSDDPFSNDNQQRDSFNDMQNNQDSFQGMQNDPFSNQNQQGPERSLQDMEEDPFSNNFQNQRDHMNNQPFDKNTNNFNMQKPFEVKEKPIVPQDNPPNLDLLNKNIEIVSSKLDTLKAELYSMNQRLIGIEASANKKETPRRYQW
ncbi:MAG: hypothetical protein ACMXX8_03320 [Candidatus Woesearchaeota archaeon]